MLIQDLPAYLTAIPAEYDLGDFWDRNRYGATFRMDPWVVAEILRKNIERTALCEAQGHRCGYCEAMTDAHGPSRYRPTIEHVVPRIRGGKRRHPLNLIMVCYGCNRTRGHNIKMVGGVDVETLVPQEARIGEAELQDYLGGLKTKDRYAKPPYTSRWGNRRRQAASGGLRWETHRVEIIETAEVIGSLYQICWFGPWRVRLANPALARPGELDIVATRSEAKKTLEGIADRVIKLRKRQRRSYEASLSAMLSKASTILPTLAA